MKDPCHWTDASIHFHARSQTEPNGRVVRIGLAPPMQRNGQKEPFSLNQKHLPTAKWSKVSYWVFYYLQLSLNGSADHNSYKTIRLGEATNKRMLKHLIALIGPCGLGKVTPVAELMHACGLACGLGLSARIISCIMHLEEERGNAKGTWRRAQTGRRLGDADERSGKHQLQRVFAGFFAGSQ